MGKLNFLIPGCGCFSRKEKSRGAGVDTQDDDVVREIEYMKTCGSNAHAVVVQNLKKNYGSHETVRGISFHVDYSQIFGLLGVNGSGKTSTFSVLTGQSDITSGNVYINNQTVASVRSGASRVGYCPQFDTIAEELTGETILYLFGRLSGISEGHVSFFVNCILDGLDLKAYAKNSISTYSGGCKRRLSLAVSLIGGPDILLLDEPTAGVDPQAKRLIWEVLRIVQKNNTAIILTSHSMEEIDLLCTNLAIMIAGKFRCYGSPQHIKNKYGSGYSVMFKVNSNTNVTQMIENFLHTFKNSRVVIQEAHQISLEIPKDCSVSWHRLFSTCEKYIEKYKLDDYFLGQTTLEQIFNDFSTNEVNTKDFRLRLN
uniref:ABC transporter domain-containing protein n=1 Tax=Rhabditophanes sp. KR3021 TaxID=114890 RepID=A0AC35TPE4_9BILA